MIFQSLCLTRVSTKCNFYETLMLPLYNIFFFAFVYPNFVRKRSHSEYIFSKLNPRLAKLNRSRCNRKKCIRCTSRPNASQTTAAFLQRWIFNPPRSSSPSRPAPTMSSPLQRDLLFGDSALLSHRSPPVIVCTAIKMHFSPILKY